MSSATKEILGRVRQLVPPMLDKFHKGEWPRPAPQRSLCPAVLGIEP